MTTATCHPIATHVVQGDSPGPRLLITGGVHGDEFEPMAAARRLIAELKTGELRGRVTLAPVVNEPAFRRGTRTADDGLDLARACPGRVDGSITERVAASLASLIRDADYYIDLHTGGTRLTVLPLAGYMLHPDPTVLDVQRRMARAFDLPLIWGTDWRLEGRSLSVARDARVPAIYCEYLGGGGCAREGVEAYVKGCLGVLVELGMLPDSASSNSASSNSASSNSASSNSASSDRNSSAISTRDGVAPSRSAHEPRGLLIAEDHRPGAGHMQVNLPAPFSGFFEPAVTLGQWVRRGEPWGDVVDELGSRRDLVRVPHDGLAIVLHSFASVAEGECLGVVLDESTIVYRGSGVAS